MRRVRLHWLCTQPTPYNDFFFRSLASDPLFELTVHFTRGVLPSRPWKTQMAQGFASRTYQRVMGLDWYLIKRALIDRRAFFVVAGWREPTMQTVLNLLMLCHRPFAVWTDTPNLMRRRGAVKALLRSCWLKLVFRRAKCVMGTGQPAREVLLQMGSAEEKTVNLPFFIDLDAFRPANHCTVKKQVYQVTFVSSGRLENAHKGYDLALAALFKAKQRACAPFRYYIAGVGQDAEILHKQTQRLGLSDQVQFLGWLEPDQLPRFYRQADVLLHPARIDPFPVTVLEGMASGLPIIGSDAAGSVCERVRHGVNGFIHHSGDVDEIAAQIAHFLDHPEDMSQMGRIARETAEEWPVARGVETVKQVVT
jgi:glycosyltransferase involved in cell wall biosynthesis